MEDAGKLLIGKGEQPQYLYLPLANRHGLIAGATGTGKTITLQVLAEQLSRDGVPVVCADVKGDLSGIGAAGDPKPKLLEPTMAVEVVTPEEYLGDVMGNLNSRRGRVEHLEPLGNSQTIKASVPLSEMFGYATDLRSMTQGRATFTMQFDRYEDVPVTIAETIVTSNSE